MSVLNDSSNFIRKHSIFINDNLQFHLNTARKPISIVVRLSRICFSLIQYDPDTSHILWNDQSRTCSSWGNKHTVFFSDLSVVHAFVAYRSDLKTKHWKKIIICDRSFTIKSNSFFIFFFHNTSSCYEKYFCVNWYCCLLWFFFNISVIICKMSV